MFKKVFTGCLGAVCAGIVGFLILAIIGAVLFAGYA